MNEPRVVINLEENIGKTVGRRRPPRDPAKVSDQLQKSAYRLFTLCGHKLTPRGVFRFKTHKEANEWQQKMIRLKKTVWRHERPSWPTWSIFAASSTSAAPDMS